MILKDALGTKKSVEISKEKVKEKAEKRAKEKVRAAEEKKLFDSALPTQKDFIDILIKSPGFIFVTEIEKFTTKAGKPGWHCKKPKWSQRRTNQGNWVYIIIIEKNNVVYLMKIGGSGADKGMESRIRSYSSGRPNCNTTNGLTNRQIYEKFVKLLAAGWKISFYAYECPTEKIKVNMPWRTEEVEGHTQTFKIYEENLIKFYEEKYGKKPVWNVNTN